MFGLVGKYIGNKETKGCHKRWLKLWLKDRGGEALSYEGFSDCVIVSVTELLVRLVEWSQASGKHFSMCEESLIPEAEDGFTTGVCGPRNHSQLAPVGHTELQHECFVLQSCLNLLWCAIAKAHISGKSVWNNYVFCTFNSFVKLDDACKVCQVKGPFLRDKFC